MTETSAGLWGAAIGIAGTVVVGGISAWVGYASKDEELKVHLVEIAIGILRADPKEDVAPARGWAIKVIDKYSDVPFSPEDSAALLHKPIKADPIWGVWKPASDSATLNMLKIPNALAAPDILDGDPSKKPGAKP
jgi:hypothetical protein